MQHKNTKPQTKFPTNPKFHKINSKQTRIWNCIMYS